MARGGADSWVIAVAAAASRLWMGGLALSAVETALKNGRQRVFSLPWPEDTHALWREFRRTNETRRSATG